MQKRGHSWGIGSLLCEFVHIQGKYVFLTEHIYLKSKKHLSKYVLVPADMATNNVIVVCKKYYVLKEITATNTYQFYGEQKYCSSAGASTFTIFQKNLMVQNLLLHQLSVLLTLYLQVARVRFPGSIVVLRWIKDWEQKFNAENT